MRQRIMSVLHRMRDFSQTLREGGDSQAAQKLSADSQIVEGLLVQFEETVRRLDVATQERNKVEGQLEKAVNAGLQYKEGAAGLQQQLDRANELLAQADSDEERAVQDAVAREKAVADDLRETVRDLENQVAILTKQQSRAGATASNAEKEMGAAKAMVSRLTTERDAAWAAVGELLRVVDGQVAPNVQQKIEQFKQTI